MTSHVCPTCGRRLLAGELQGTSRVMACICGYTEQTQAAPVAVAVVAVREPVAAPRKRRRQPEAKLVGEIAKALRARGFVVLRVGQWRADLAGQTAGTPDLWVTHPTWIALIGPLGWLPMEVKDGDKGTLSPKQKDLRDACDVPTVRNLDDALRVVANPRALIPT